MNDEAWLLDVVKRCGVHEARAAALARAGAQMLRRLAIKCPPGVFGKGECCRRAVALELAARASWTPQRLTTSRSQASSFIFPPGARGAVL